MAVVVVVAMVFHEDPDSFCSYVYAYAVTGDYRNLAHCENIGRPL